MIEIFKYSPEYKSQWDDVVKHSGAGTFLFYRDYMDYHSSRFKDCSFLFSKNGKIEAIIPGNISGNKYFSHQGLTYGGLVKSAKTSTDDILEIFKIFNQTLKKLNITEVIYKPVPLIYHTFPCQEDIYALFRLDALKIGCNISTAIFQKNKINYSTLRKRCIKKGNNLKIISYERNYFSKFWEILSDNLKSKYNISPVHTLEEIEDLHLKFKDNIRLHVALLNERVIAGVVVYVMPNVVHVQYIAASEAGKKTGALDVLFDKLINEFYTDVPVFEFGHSTEQMGSYLNKDLIFQKEGFGGRGIVYDIYKYNL